LIATRRATQGRGDDAISMLLEASTGEAKPLTDRELRDEVMTLFMAGHETTAVALAWSLYLLSENPEAAESLEAELAEVLDGRLPTVADLPRLRYTEAVVSEALRLYPPAYALSREAIKPTTVAGRALPKGGIAFISVWATTAALTSSRPRGRSGQNAGSTGSRDGSHAAPTCRLPKGRENASARLSRCRKRFWYLPRSPCASVSSRLPSRRSSFVRQSPSDQPGRSGWQFKPEPRARRAQGVEPEAHLVHVASPFVPESADVGSIDRASASLSSTVRRPGTSA
jgi:hypothetical protein